jgi:toxin ParE1/3/4
LKWQLIIAPSAIRDLKGIHDFIARDNVEAAGRYIERLYCRFELLCHQPGIGRNREEVEAGYRSVVEGEHVIFYQPMPDETLEIKRVIHSKRDLSKAMKESKT